MVSKTKLALRKADIELDGVYKSIQKNTRIMAEKVCRDLELDLFELRVYTKIKWWDDNSTIYLMQKVKKVQNGNKTKA